MHPVLIIGIFVIGACLWLLLSSLYRPIGWVGKRLVDDAKRNMLEDNNIEEEKSKEEK
jgi:hypothetical protein